MNSKQPGNAGPDIFSLAYLASEFERDLRHKLEAEPGLSDDFNRAATGTESAEVQAIYDALDKRISHENGGDEDAVQAPRAAMVVRLADIYAAVCLRVMDEKEAAALIPPKARGATNSDAFAANNAPNLAKLFRP